MDEEERRKDSNLEAIRLGLVGLMGVEKKACRAGRWHNIVVHSQLKTMEGRVGLNLCQK